MKDYYEILEVNNKASLDTIKKVFKMQIKKYHPDTVTQEDKAFAENKVIELNEAYDVLSDEVKRKEYDEKLKSETMPSENEQLLRNQIEELKNKLYEKEQIIDHFLGGMDLSEYENSINNIHEKFKYDDIKNYEETDENIDKTEYTYNENPKNLLEKIQNFYNPNRPSKSISEGYIHTFLVYLTKIIGIIIACVCFFLLISIFTGTNVFEIIYKVFFKK